MSHTHSFNLNPTTSNQNKSCSHSIDKHSHGNAHNEHHKPSSDLEHKANPAPLQDKIRKGKIAFDN